MKVACTVREEVDRNVRRYREYGNGECFYSALWSSSWLPFYYINNVTRCLPTSCNYMFLFPFLPVGRLGRYVKPVGDCNNRFSGQFSRLHKVGKVCEARWGL